MRPVLLGALALAAALGVAVVLLVDDDDSPARIPNGPVELEAVRRFDDFPLYWLGESFDGLPLTRAEDLRQEVVEARIVGDDVLIGFDYGTCELPEEEGGCSPPLTVYTDPARRLPEHAKSGHTIYTLGVLGRVWLEDETDQIPAVELYTGGQIVSIEGSSSRRIHAAVRALRRANPPGRPLKRLPPPRFDVTP